jgi:hypothetical protein
LSASEHVITAQKPAFGFAGASYSFEKQTAGATFAA